MEKIVWRATTAFALVIVTIGCLENPATLEPTSPSEQPPNGVLRIKVETNGDDPDLDGYELSIDRQSRAAIRPAETIAIRLLTGIHELRLQGVDNNCTIQGQHPRILTVERNVTLDVTFSVICDVIGYAVVTRTSGSDLPFQLGYAVDGGASQTILGPNDSVAIRRQRPGIRSILLGDFPENCQSASRNPVTVELTPKSLAVVRFELACARTEKRIAFVTADRIMTADARGSFLTAIRPGRDPSWSSTGSKIAFTNRVCSESACWSDGLAIIDVETRSMTILANTAGAVEPAWSPDGNAIAFAQGNNLFTIRPDGSDRRTLTDENVRSIRNPSWSPDGKRLVFDCGTALTISELCVVSSDGSGLKRLTDNMFDDANATWSPDGLWIAFETNRFSGENDIAIMKADGTDTRKVVTGFGPAWMPDGERLLFAGLDGIFTVRTDGTQVTRITTGEHYSPAWRQ